LEGRPLARVWRIAVSDVAKAREIVRVITGVSSEEIGEITDWPDNEMRGAGVKSGEVRSE
jgi:hypothetical protein